MIPCDKVKLENKQTRFYVSSHLARRGLACPDVRRKGRRLPLGERVVKGGDDGRRVRHDGLDVLELEVAHGVPAVDEVVENLSRILFFLVFRFDATRYDMI